MPARTQLFNIDGGVWDPELLALFGVLASVLPEVVASNQPAGDAILLAREPIPICGILGDSHAALLLRLHPRGARVRDKWRSNPGSLR
jgi:glycerol kinase